MRKLLFKIKNLYFILKEKFEKHFVLIFIIVMVGAMLCTMGTTWFFPSYYSVEIEELITKQDELIELQSRELTFATNELKLQIAYTERLKLILDLNNIEYERYSEFLNEDLFANNELMDKGYLYENELDINILLTKARILEDTFYGKD